MPESSLKELAGGSSIRRRKGKGMCPGYGGKAEAVKIGRIQVLAG